MKTYSIDGNPKIFWLSLLFLLFIPFIGAWFFGTRLTSFYAKTRVAGGSLATITIIFHTLLLLNIFLC